MPDQIPDPSAPVPPSEPSKSIFQSGLDPDADKLSCSLDAKFALFENLYKEMQASAMRMLSTDAEIGLEIGAEMATALEGNGGGELESIAETAETDAEESEDTESQTQSQFSTTDGTSSASSTSWISEKSRKFTDLDFSEIQLVRGEKGEISVKLNKTKAENVDGSQPLMLPGDGPGESQKCVLPWGEDVDWGSSEDEGEGSESDTDAELTPEHLDRIHYRAAVRIRRQCKKRGLYISESTLTGAGCGVFANRTFKKGETVMYYDGRVICKPLPSESGKDDSGQPQIYSRLKKARTAAGLPLLGLDGNLVELAKTDRASRFLMELDCYHDMCGGTVSVGNAKPYAGTVAAYSNSCLGQEARENMLGISDYRKGLGARCVKFVTTKEVNKGEELLWEYKYSCNGCKEEENDPVWGWIKRLEGEEKGGLGVD